MTPAIQWLGRMPYGDALALQESLVSERAAGRIPDTLLLLEHPPTVTIGPAAQPEHLLVPEEELCARGIDVQRVRRGGGVTLHLPGQLVGYPIVDLAPLGRDLRAYLRRLERMLARVAAGYGVQAGGISGLTGVWAGGEKLAAIGIQVRRGIAFHGFALNVDPDLSLFDLIIPCGIVDRGVTSLRRLGAPAPTLRSVAEQVARDFAEEMALGADRGPQAG